jgi:hypothetical protein
MLLLNHLLTFLNPDDEACLIVPLNCHLSDQPLPLLLLLPLEMLIFQPLAHVPQPR